MKDKRIVAIFEEERKPEDKAFVNPYKREPVNSLFEGAFDWRPLRQRPRDPTVEIRPDDYGRRYQVCTSFDLEMLEEVGDVRLFAEEMGRMVMHEILKRFGDSPRIYGGYPR